MQCSKCNQKVNPEDKFCMYCGNNLENDGATYSEEAQITSVPHCPSCHAEVNPDDKFCMQCGFNLATASNSNSHIRNLENQTKENVSLADEAKQLFNNTTKSIGKMAGNEESLNLNLRDMFSEVFKSHSREEVIVSLLQVLKKRRLPLKMFPMNGAAHGYFLEYLRQWL